ncbi:GIY-YIG nuclease family protein [Arthrobacter sp. USHLN218]|uniref:GIY-YIG nuclease family protein n=1 Tax=Arthrobacter sp. USHLN218 TaxID=3081232 RepID=UPI0030170243
MNGTYNRQCVASVQEYDGTYRRCTRDSNERHDATVPLCHAHFKAAFRQIAQPIAEQLERERKKAARHHCDAERAVQEYIEEEMEQHIQRNERRKAATLVYFMRCDAYIKIGVSTSPRYRLEQIRKAGGVLAPHGIDLQRTELITSATGGYPRERALHAKFAHLRHTGEWFTEAPELTEYIDNLKETNDASTAA